MRRILPLIIVAIFLTGCTTPQDGTGASSGLNKGLILNAFGLDCGGNVWCGTVSKYPGSEITVMANITNNEKIDINNVFIELFNLYDLQPTAGTEAKQTRDIVYKDGSDEIVWYLKIREDAPVGTSYAIGTRMCYSYTAHAEKDILLVDKSWSGTLPPLINKFSEGPLKISVSWVGETPLKITPGQSKKIDININKVASGFVGSDFASTVTYGERDKLTDLILSFDNKHGFIKVTEKGHFENCDTYDIASRINCTITDPSILKLNQGTEKTIYLFLTADTTDPSFELSTRFYIDARYKFCVEGDKFLRVSVEELK